MKHLIPFKILEEDLSRISRSTNHFPTNSRLACIYICTSINQKLIKVTQILVTTQRTQQSKSNVLSITTTLWKPMHKICQPPGSNDWRRSRKWAPPQFGRYKEDLKILRRYKDSVTFHHYNLEVKEHVDKPINFQWLYIIWFQYIAYAQISS